MCSIASDTEVPSSNVSVKFIHPGLSLEHNKNSPFKPENKPRALASRWQGGASLGSGRHPVAPDDESELAPPVSLNLAAQGSWYPLSKCIYQPDVVLITKELVSG